MSDIKTNLGKLLLEYANSLHAAHTATDPGAFTHALKARDGEEMVRYFMSQRSALTRHLYLLSQVLDGDAPVAEAKGADLT